MEENDKVKGMVQRDVAIEVLGYFFEIPCLRSTGPNRTPFF